MHVKNFSLIRREGKVELSPAYDLLNATIAVRNATEELALPLHGKKNNLKRSDLIDYFAFERLALTKKVVENTVNELTASFEQWNNLIGISLLSNPMKQSYLSLLDERRKRLEV